MSVDAGATQRLHACDCAAIRNGLTCDVEDFAGELPVTNLDSFPMTPMPDEAQLLLDAASEEAAVEPIAHRLVLPRSNQPFVVKAAERLHRFSSSPATQWQYAACSPTAWGTPHS